MHRLHLTLRCLGVQVPISFIGTNVIRELSRSQQRSVLAEVRRLLSNATYSPFFFEDDDVSVISGEEQAVNDWVAANYKAGRLGSGQVDAGWVGVVDMDGSETRVVFETPQASNQSAREVGLLTGSGATKFQLYAHNYRPLSEAKAHRDMNDRCHGGQATPGAVIPTPCYLRGFTAPAPSACGANSSFVGTGEYDECTGLIQRFVVRKGDACPISPCSFNGIYQPRLDRKRNSRFYANGPVFMTSSRFLGVHEGASLREREEAGRQLSKISYDEALQRYGNDYDPDFIAEQVFTAAYLDVLMAQGLGLDQGATT